MFKSFRKPADRRATASTSRNVKRKSPSELASFSSSPFIVPSFDVEPLENRQLLSVAHSALSHCGGGSGSGSSGAKGGGPGGDHGGGRGPVGEIVFSLAPTAVQTGLTSLASTDGDTAPTSTTEVMLGNSNGVETYSLHETSTGTSSTLTVDASGNAVTKPTNTTTTFGAITNTAVTSEFNAIATAISATAPASTASVSVSTASNGVITYTVGLVTTSSNGKTHTTRYSVDGNGNPVGNTRVPLSVLSTAVQNGLTSNAPSGATALTATSMINVETVDGVTLYTAKYSSTGTRTSISVNTSGALTSMPTTTKVTFSALPAAAQSELQTLATAEGVTTTIATTQSVTELTEANGTVLYSVNLKATSTSNTSETYSITLTVDSAGNPTVTPGGGGGGGGMFGGRFGELVGGM